MVHTPFTPPPTHSHKTPPSRGAPLRDSTCFRAERETLGERWGWDKCGGAGNDEAVVCMLLCCCLSELNWVLLELKRGFIHGFGLICAFKAATIFILKPRSSSSFDIESFFYHIFCETSGASAAQRDTGLHTKRCALTRKNNQCTYSPGRCTPFYSQHIYLLF